MSDGRFIPPEDPPPVVAEHLRHMTDGRWHDRCRFCRRRREKGGTGVLPEDYLPQVPMSAVHDLLVEARRALTPPNQIEASVSQIEGEAWDDWGDDRRISFTYLAVLSGGGLLGMRADGRFRCDFTPGRHCDHWTYTPRPCCKCGMHNYDPRSTGCTEVLWAPQGGAQ